MFKKRFAKFRCRTSISDAQHSETMKVVAPETIENIHIKVWCWSIGDARNRGSYRYTWLNGFVTQLSEDQAPVETVGFLE